MDERQTLRAACSDMTAYMAVLLTRAAFEPETVAQAGEPLRGWAISASEEAEGLVTHTLGLATVIEGHLYGLTKPTDEFPEHFASGRYDTCFDRILWAYLGLVTWNEAVPTQRIVFEPPQDHRHILRGLAALGFLSVSSHGVAWTDLAGPAMLNAGAWTPDLQSHAEIAELELEEEALRLARGLPSDLVTLARANPEAAFWPVHRSLEGDAWWQMPDKRLVERIIELVHSRKVLGGTWN